MSIQAGRTYQAEDQEMVQEPERIRHHKQFLPIYERHFRECGSVFKAYRAALAEWRRTDGNQTDV